MKEKLSIGDENTIYLDGIIAALSQFKFTDTFSILQKILENYRGPVSTEDFESRLYVKERAFYQTVVGLLWTWSRLVVLRANAFKMESYVRDVAQFLDESEYSHHEAHMFTNEAIDYTFNFIKYA